MNIAKGIKGIRQTLAENNSGWHLFFSYDGGDWTLGPFCNAPMKTIIAQFSDAGYTLKAYSGNQLYLSK